MDPYLGEIRMFAGNFAPYGWALCDGRQLNIHEYEELFSLIGTVYGGDGRSTFAVPDLRGRLPIHRGNGFTMGESGGVESVTLTSTQIPPHRHTLNASRSAAVSAVPTGQVPASDGALAYAEDRSPAPLHPATLGPAGGNQPHSNLMPYTCVNFVIALWGIYPSRS